MQRAARLSVVVKRPKRLYNAQTLYLEMTVFMSSNQEIESTASPSEEQGQAVHPMDLLLAEEAYELETPRRGEIRTGVIARVSENDILVDIGAKSEGVISSQEMAQLPPISWRAWPLGKK